MTSGQAVDAQTRAKHGRVAILYPGDREARQDARLHTSRFADLAGALADQGLHVEPAVYHDDFCEEVRVQLLQADGVLVWVNPIEGGRDRSILDRMLREVAAAGVFVSTHPDTILKLGTKEVLHSTRGLGWGCDTHLYRSVPQMLQELPHRLAGGKARVLKQYRGNGGTGVWRVQLLEGAAGTSGAPAGPLPGPETLLRARHAKRGCIEEGISMGEFVSRCEEYLSSGPIIDQEYQERLPEGMIRCYLVLNQVVGFGHQAINALFPQPHGAPAAEAPQPGPRLYHPPTRPEFQALKLRLEAEWVPEVQALLGVPFASLPILWDCDFLLGSKTADGEDTHVLCEINVSSVAPYPESAVPGMAAAVLARVEEARTRRTTGS